MYKRKKDKDNVPSSGAEISPDRSVSTALNQFHNLQQTEFTSSTERTPHHFYSLTEDLLQAEAHDFHQAVRIHLHLHLHIPRKTKD